MLTHIHIQNFTLVEALSLDFSSGFSVLTGETGAGKSIWVDAVELALGERADVSVIRQGQERCDISLCFDIGNNSKAQHWLAEQQLESDNQCIIRRTLHSNAPSRCTINGVPCPLHLVREIADLLIATHGQHQHHALLKRDLQRDRLDNYAGHESWLATIRDIFRQWQDLNHELELLQAQAQNRDEELAILQYQLDEVSRLDLQKDEWQNLFSKHQQLHHAQDIMLHVNQALDLTQEHEPSASHLLNQALQHMTAVCNKDPLLNSVQEMLNTACIHVQEACDELSRYRDQLDLSPEHLTTVENRISAIHDLARKHRMQPEELYTLESVLNQKINVLKNIDEKIESLKDSQSQLLKSYQAIAKKLSASRVKAAEKINQLITQHMQTLGMEGGQFRVVLEKIPDEINLYGNEKISFEVITNPGHDFQPLNKIVSGGELSRISLALQLITAEKEAVPTLIFDEVDVGIGGKTATMVGKLLRQLGEKVQVLCITHLPQVAALGHHHYQAIKQVGKHSTATTINLLEEKKRIAELARMLGGSDITDQTLAHAKEMLGTVSISN